MISMADPTLTLRNAFTKRIQYGLFEMEWSGTCMNDDVYLQCFPKKDARSLELKNISDLLIDALQNGKY